MWSDLSCSPRTIHCSTLVTGIWARRLLMPKRRSKKSSVCSHGASDCTHTMEHAQEPILSVNPSKSIISQNTLARFSHFWGSLFLSSLYTHMQVKWPLPCHASNILKCYTDIPSSQLILSIWYQVCCKASVSNNISKLFFLFLFPTPQWATSIRSQLT